MGGDNGPRTVCRAAINYLKQQNDATLTLVGPKTNIETYLKDETADAALDRIDLIDATEVITPQDEAVRAIRRKKDASMVQALQFLKRGEADVLVSAGNTGALLAGSILICGRIAGIERPAVASRMPTLDGHGFLMLDLGAAVDVKPKHLVDYATMGAVYASAVTGVEKPRVGLLNIGTEMQKGDNLRRASYGLLEEWGAGFDAACFVGNVESRDLLVGRVDVTVTDGFAGNMVLKAFEGVVNTLQAVIKRSIGSSLRGQVGGALLAPILRRDFAEFDYHHYGGAVLLGVKKPVIKCHGNADEQAIVSALVAAHRAATTRVIDRITAVFVEGRSEG